MDPARLWMPYCGEAPRPEDWLSRWNTDPLLLAALAVLALLAALPWATRPGRRGAQRLPPALRPREGRWLLAVGLFALLYVSPLCALGSALFTARIVHDLVLFFALAPLLAHGLADARQPPRLPPWTCTALATAVFWFWHAPGPYAAALASDAVFWAMQLTLLGAATAFWLAMRRAEPPLAIAAILVSMVTMGLLGALIAFATTPWYAPHAASTSAWGLTPLADQQLAGIVMWAPGSAVYLGAALWIGLRWLRRERDGDLTVGTA